MGRFICKLEDKYFEFSTIVDAPVTYPMTLDEFKEYYQEEYGNQGMNGLDNRLERVEKIGTSSRIHLSVDETLRVNYGGKDGTCLSLDQFKEWVRGDKELEDMVGKKL